MKRFARNLKEKADGICSFSREEYGRRACGLAEGWRQIGPESLQPRGGELDRAAAILLLRQQRILARSERIGSDDPDEVAAQKIQADDLTKLFDEFLSSRVRHTDRWRGGQSSCWLSRPGGRDGGR